MKNIKTAQIIRNLIVMLACLILLGACGLNEKETQSGACGAVPLEQKVHNFEQTIFPATNKCKSCHGVSQAPMFQVDDAAQAFGNAVNYISGNPAKMSVKANDGHGGAIAQNNDAIVAAIKEYNEKNQISCDGGESSTGDPTDPLKDERALSSADPLTGLNAQTYVTKNFTFAADAKMPTTLRNLSLQIEFKLYSAPGYVIMRNIRVLTPDENARVRSVMVTLDAEFQGDQYSTYREVDRTVSKGATAINIAPDSMLVKFEPGSGHTFQVSAAFEAVSNPIELLPGETEPDFFARVIAPALQSNPARCVNCHSAAGHAMQFAGTTSPSALRTLIMTGRVVADNPGGSLIYQKTVLGNPTHGGGTPLAGTVDAQALANWINAL